jgi:hypothetical protein
MTSSMPDAQGIVILLFVVLVAVVVLLLVRELVCWYWKLNKIVVLLERIAGALEKAQVQEIKAGDTTASAELAELGDGDHHWGKNDKTHDVVRTCPNCGVIYHGAEFERCLKCQVPLKL